VTKRRAAVRREWNVVGLAGRAAPVAGGYFWFCVRVVTAAVEPGGASLVAMIAW
jgi:hypothetical protein